MPVRAILVADSDPAVRALAHEVVPADWNVDTVSGGRGLLNRLSARPYDVVVAEASARQAGRLGLLNRIRQRRPETKVLLTAAGHNPAAVVAAMRNHAFGYFTKPLSPAAFKHVLASAAETAEWAGDIEVLSGCPEWLTLRVRCKLDSADRLLQFLHELEMEMPLPQREDVTIALRELLMNAIEHGGGSNPAKYVSLSRIRTARAICYHLRDPGNGFSFNKLPHAAVSNPPEAPVQHVEIRAEQGVRPGGFGILMARNLADELIYNEAGNEVLFLKYRK